MAEPRLPPQHPTIQKDIQTIQTFINAQQAYINWATRGIRRSEQQIQKMVEALVNIKQFSQTTIGPLNERSCKNRDCKDMQERLERALRSIIDLVNNSMQLNE